MTAVPIPRPVGVDDNDFLTLANGELTEGSFVAMRKTVSVVLSPDTCVVKRSFHVSGFEEQTNESSRAESRRRLLNWCCCGIPRRTCCRRKRSWRFPQPGATVQPLLLWFLIFIMFLYGFTFVFRAKGASLNVSDYVPGDMFLVLSRSFAKGLSMLWLLGLIIAVRGFNNTANALSFEQKQWIKWRIFHKALMALGLVFAALHIVFHCIRIYVYAYPGPSAALPQGYDYYQTGIGFALMFFLIIMVAYYPFRTAGENVHRVKSRKIREARSACSRFGAKWFRFLHWQLYWVVATLYAIHSYSMTLVLLWIIWTVDYYLHRVPVNQLFYVNFAQSKGGPRITCLVAKMSIFSPQGIGVYYQLGLGTGFARMWASYTGIPVGTRAVMFMIAPCAFTSHLESFIDDINYEHGVRHASEGDMSFLRSIVHLRSVLDDPTTVVWTLERRGTHVGVGGVREIPFQLYGPYHSNSSDVNNHSRCLVISSGIGSSVRDAIVAHQLQCGRLWKRLVCLHMAGRSPAPPSQSEGASTLALPRDIGSLDQLLQFLSQRRSPYGDDVIVEHIEMTGSTNHLFWHRVIQAAVPQDPVSSEDRAGKTEAEVQQMADKKRYVIIVCGRKAGEVVEGALQHFEPTMRLSQEQLQYIDIEEFK